MRGPGKRKKTSRKHTGIKKLITDNGTNVPKINTDQNVPKTIQKPTTNTDNTSITPQINEIKQNGNNMDDNELPILLNDDGSDSAEVKSDVPIMKGPPSISVESSTVNSETDDDGLIKGIPRLKSPTSMDVYSWIFKDKIVEAKSTDDNENTTSECIVLKPEPTQPWDVSSTVQDFETVSNILMLGCNNPKSLFKVIKGVCMKLKLDDPKYRIMNPANSQVQSKLLRYEGTDEFLYLLGFEKRDNDGVLKCPNDQPPLSVINNAIHVCDIMLTRCIQKRAAIDMIKMFSQSSNKKKRSKKLSKKMRKLPKSKSIKVLPKLRPLQAEISAPITPTVSQSDTERISLTRVHSVNSAVSMNSEDREHKFTSDVDGDNDKFYLSELINGITHENNPDKEAAGVLLLTYVTFTDALTLFKMLQDRFFENNYYDPQSNTEYSVSEQSRTDTVGSTFSIANPFSTALLFRKIESSFGVQAKVRI